MRHLLTCALLSAAALAAASPALATDWVVGVADGDRQTVILVDRDSREVTPERLIRIWTMDVFIEDRQGMAAIAAQAEYDCAARRYRRIYVRGYRADASVAGQGQRPGDWIDPTPSTLDEGQFDFVCGEEFNSPERRSLGSGSPIAAARAFLRE